MATTAASREHCQERIKRHPGGDRNDSVLADVVAGAQNDVPPSTQRNISWRVGVPPAIRFAGPVHLGLGMILTAGLRSGQVCAHAAPLEANPAAREIFTRQRQKRPAPRSPLGATSSCDGVILAWIATI
jgi:hypothetical protein